MAARRVLGQFLAYFWPSLDVACAIGGLILLPSEQVNALGWSIQAPLFCVLIRLIWLLLLLVLAKAANGASKAGRARSVSRIEHILHEAFPYVAYVPLAVLCLVRLISDPPKAPHNSNARFWTFLVFGFLCSLGENYMSLAEIHRFQSTEPQSLGIELSSTDGSNGTAGSASGSGESQNAAKKKDSVWKLLNLVAKEWPLLIQASICLLVAAISDVLIPHYISETISEIILAEERGKLADRPYKRPVICLLIAAGSSAVFSACRGGTFIVIGGRLAQRLRCTLFAALMQQEIGFFDTTQIGELTSRMTQDCQQVVEQASLNVNVFLRTLVSIITTLAFMFSITTPLTCVAFVSVPAVVAISMKYSNIFRQISENAQKSLADANAVANEGLGNMSTLRSFAAEDLEMQRFGVAMGVYRKLMKKRAMFYLVYFTSTMMLPQVVTAVVLFYGGKLTLEGQMRAKSLLSFVFYLQTLNNNFSTLGDFYTNMIQAAGAAVRVFELRERQPDAPMSGELKPAQDLQQGALILRDVHFSYPARPDVKVLHGLSLEILASQVVALVGPSGNGKSTVIGLVKRLYHAAAGDILLDGIPVWQYSHSHFHRVVSIVGQEPVLFARSIRENILLGLTNPKMVAGEVIPSAGELEISDMDIRDFARKANADDFIIQMSQGYDAEVGERGVQLSGGQKQRIAIARALARRPKVLLLDEATSALDAESESQVQRAIDGMIKEGCMTVVIIAHRLSTVKNSHKICVIKGGQVVEEGTHEDLLKRGGSYFQLVQCQLSAGEKQTIEAKDAEKPEG